MTGKVPDLLAEIALCFVDLICHTVIVWWLKIYIDIQQRAVSSEDVYTYCHTWLSNVSKFTSKHCDVLLLKVSKYFLADIYLNALLKYIPAIGFRITIKYDGSKSYGNTVRRSVFPQTTL